MTNSYGSGLMYEGVLAYTTVNFGNGLATRKIPVALVRRASCVPTASTCPATPNQQNCPGVKPGPNAGIRCLEVGRKLFGTFGTALATIPVPSPKPVTELYNVLFGTGAYNVDFLGPVNLPLMQTHCGERVKTGTPFEMRLPNGTTLESFHVGERANWNVVENHPHGTRPKINTGLTFYNRDEILFDAANGRVGLQKLATPGQISRSGCF